MGVRSETRLCREAAKTVGSDDDNPVPSEGQKACDRKRAEKLLWTQLQKKPKKPTDE